MLVAGGLLDQPADLWFTVQYAGWVESILDRVAKKDFKWDQFTESETEFYMESLQPLQMEPMK